MGRKPLPTEVKKLQGTLRPERVHADQMKPSPFVHVPLPPDYLGEIAKKEWTIIVSNYAKLGMLSSLDSSIIAAYCNEIEIYIEATNELRGKSKLIKAKNPDGSIKGHAPHPLLKVAKDALDRALKIAVELGLTPAARTKIAVSQVNETKAEPDEFDI